MQTLKLPTLISVEDYHEFGSIVSHLKDFEVEVDFKEVSNETGYYMALFYEGSIASNANRSFMKKNGLQFVHGILAWKEDNDEQAA